MQPELAWRRAGTALVRVALDLVYPPRCGGCGRRGAWLCMACLAAMQPPLEAGWICAVCRQPLRAGAGGLYCPDLCDSGGLSGVLCAGAYADPLASAIQRFKYGQDRYEPWRVLADPLAVLLAASVAAAPLPWPEGVLPHLLAVPLHPRRRRERGFNQAAVLATRLGARLGWPMLAGLVRVRYTLPQAQYRLTVDERAANLDEAFAWRGGPPPAGPLVLVDDVYTSGVTLGLCAEALRAAGGGPVYGLALAQATGPPLL
ncbi:MAG TPA: ComF family protein [Chloroflexia bacterium]|nr:ComF family protein [Chloroflexia bacterium]